MDSKGRVSIPARFRAVLEDQDPEWSEGKPARMHIVYGNHLNGYVECYSAAAMSEKIEMILRLPQADKKTKIMRRWFMTQSLDFSIDDTGRIVLPAKVRDKINVAAGETAMFAGIGKTFQIWNPEAYNEMIAEEEAEFFDDEDEVDFDPDAIFDTLREAPSAPLGEG